MSTTYVTPAVINEYAALEGSPRWYLSTLGALLTEEPFLQQWLENQLNMQAQQLDHISNGGYTSHVRIPLEVHRLSTQWFMRGIYIATRRLNGDLSKSLGTMDLMKPEPSSEKHLAEGQFHEEGEIDQSDFRDPLEDQGDQE